MNILKECWQNFLEAFRAERQGGHGAELSRKRTAEMKEELEMNRVATELAKATTAEEKEAAARKLADFVLRDRKG